MLRDGNKQRLDKTLFYILLASVISFFLSLTLSLSKLPLDQLLAKNLLAAFNSPVIGLSKSFSGRLAEMILLTVLSAGAVLSGFKLSLVPRIFTLLQLIILGLLGFWALAAAGHYPGHPVALLGAIVTGGLAGWGLRRWDTSLQKHQSRYYELLLKNQELAMAKVELVKQDEVERRMLAADLHDQVLNDLRLILQKFNQFVQEPEISLAGDIQKLLTQATNQVREVMESLYPSTIQHLGLAAAIEDCLRQGAQKANFKGHFLNKLKNGELEKLSLIEQSLLYRLVQESITNVCKHAGANNVQVLMENQDGLLMIRTVDDGCGIGDIARNQDSRGLRYMRQRADLIGATISWHQRAQGTVVEIRINRDGKNQD